MLAQSGQHEQIFSEVQRSKALEVALADVTVKNTDGQVLELDLDLEEEPAEGEADAETEEPASQEAAAAQESAEDRSEEHTSELQSRGHLVCRLLLEKKKKKEIGE